ncbi:hypothetical protein JCM15519_16990 [Fundidesulfovibrio butyratiphilus]
MPSERSIDVFRSLYERKDDLVVREFVKGLGLSIHEGHRALEALADPRLIAIQQGRIELARHIIKGITEPIRIKGDK